jgi:CubicO group peptidase (beta-lactamase class C family)
MVGVLGALGAGLPAWVPAAAQAPDEDILAKVADQAIAFGARAVVIADSAQTLLQRGAVSQPSRIASIRKSFLSALIGTAVRDGKLNLGASIASLGIEDDRPLTPVESRATVRQLMQARSGIYLPAAAETPDMRAMRPERGSHAPGSFWYYNNWDFNVLGEIYRRAAGEDVFAGFERRLARPLGFQDFDPRRHARYDYERERSRYPAYNLWLSARDLARFGQLYLRRGAWNGRQLVPASWVRESTAPVSATGGTGWWSGYGHLWWTPRGGAAAGLPLGSFTASGNGGRYIAVFPSHDLVMAIQPDEREGAPPVRLFTQRGALDNLMRLLLTARG